MIEYEITIKDHTVEVLALAKWVHSVSGHLLKDSLYIARCLLSGETWRPTGYIAHQENSFCHIARSYSESKHEKSNREYLDTQKGYFELMKKGAAGDAAAAMEYCKLELKGKVNHGAYA